MKEWLNDSKTRRIGFSALGVILFFTLVSLIGKRQEDTLCLGAVINIDSKHKNYFVNEHDIEKLINLEGSTMVRGSRLGDIDLKALEVQVETHKFVEDAQIYKDVKGNLMVDVKQVRPIARVIQNDAPDAYISSKGNTLPTSKRFVSRVLLLSGTGVSEIVDKGIHNVEYGDSLLAMLQFINDDAFWKAQIAQVAINEKGDIVMYPQVTKQVIEFGKPSGIENKFNKLAIFYDQILPLKGWNTYEKVKLEYDGQIVCE